MRQFNARKLNIRPPGMPDVLAGASVALVLIPQAMAYAELAGLPPQVGLFAAALPLIFAAPFVSSPFLQTGPVALTGILTFGALQGLGEPFTDTYVELAVLLALMVGVMRLVLGALRLGSLAYLLSNPVLTGFTTGAAVLIVASQIPRAAGVAGGGDGVLMDALTTLGEPQHWELSALLYGAATALLMIVGRRVHPLFPGVLVAVLGGIILSAATNYGGSTIGALPGGFIKPHLNFPWDSTVSLLPAAAAIALVGFAEPSSIARAFAAQDRTMWDANREMISQGVANVTSALSGGLPVGGSFSRSAIGRLAGAQTRWAGAVTGIIVLIALPFAPLAEPLPRAVLAAIVIVSVLKLVDVRTIVRLFRESWPQGVVGLGTLVATLGFAPRVERGVFVGVGLAIAVHLYRELNITAAHTIEGATLTVHPQGVLWFATVPQIERWVQNNIAAHREINTVCVDLAGVGRLDYTGAATLKQVAASFAAAGIKFEISNVPPGAKRAATIHLSKLLADDVYVDPMKSIAADDRPFDFTPIDTTDLPSTPTRDRNIAATAWNQAPAALLTLGEPLQISAAATAYKRRIGTYLLWRAGPARGPARYVAIDADDLSRYFIFSLATDADHHGVGPSGVEHTRFRAWKEDLLGRL